MPRFAQFRYGSQYYGRGIDTVTYSTLLAQAVDYHAVSLRVEAPSRDGMGYIILRSKTGASEEPSEGLIVSSGVVTATSFTFIDGVDNFTDDATDNNIAIPNGMVYYTLFIVDAAGSWTKDAATSVMMPKDRGTIQFFRTGLPGFYTSEEHNPIDPHADTSDLMRFLYGFSMTYDELAEHIDILLPENRGRGNIRRLHDTYANSVGMPSEYTIGIATTSRLFRESGFIYRNKGTVSGIATYVESLTGWQTTVTESTNMLLSIDDGSFEYSTGNWGISGGTLAKVTTDGPTFPYEATNAPFSRLGVGEVTLTSTAATMTLPGNASRLGMIPVTAGTTYYINVPHRRGTSASPTVAVSVRWHNERGDALSTTSVASGTAIAPWVTLSDTTTAPTGAAFATLIITITGASGNKVQLDMISFSESDGPYRDPRSVTIICQPDRVNLVFDPSIDYSPTTWSATAGTFTASSTHTLLGGKSGKGVGTVVAPFRFVSNTVPVLPSSTYSLTAYAYSSGGTCSADIRWYDGDGDLVSQEIAAFDTLSADWTRLDHTMLSPDTAETATVSFVGTGTVYVDAVTFERSDHSDVFFSGGIADSYGQDSSWSDGTPQSYSLLYANRFVKRSRLRQTIDHYLPVGVTSRVLLWDSQDPEVQALLPNG